MPTLAPRLTRTAPRRRLSTKTKVLIAVLGSLLLHGVLILVLGWVLPHWPHAKLQGHPLPIHLTFAPSKPAAAPAKEPAGTRPEYVRTLDEQKSDAPPDDPKFISDKDTKAAAELAANGDKPIPTMDGRDIPVFDFDTRPYRQGKEAQDAASAAPAAPPPPDQPRKTPDVKKPAPHTKALHPPKPPATPKPPGELAAVAPETTPPPDQPPTPDQTPDEASAPPPRPNASEQASANPSVNSPGLKHPPGYQPQTIKTKATGGITNHGPAAVAALGTPLGRYQKTVEDCIGMLWYQFTEQRMDVLSAGEIKVHFYIDRSGRVEQVAVSSGKSNGALADISIQAVTEAPIPPIPPEVAATLDGGRLEYDFGFGVY